MNSVATTFATQPVCNTAWAAHELCSKQFQNCILHRNVFIIITSDKIYIQAGAEQRQAQAQLCYLRSSSRF
jgi:hypothetical protein